MTVEEFLKTPAGIEYMKPYTALHVCLRPMNNIILCEKCVSFIYDACQVTRGFCSAATWTACAARTSMIQARTIAKHRVFDLHNQLVKIKRKWVAESLKAAFR